VIAAVAAAVLVLAGGDALREKLEETATLYLANVARIAPIAGRDTTFDYYERLRQDVASLDDSDVPEGYTASEWLNTRLQPRRSTSASPSNCCASPTSRCETFVDSPRRSCARHGTERCSLFPCTCRQRIRALGPPR